MSYIVNFSGGKDSTAMLLMMIEKSEPIEEIIFFDTGWEFPEMYDHINLIESNIGMKITRLKPDKTFSYWMFDHEISRGNRKGENGYGFARPNARWCTGLKSRTINNYLKNSNSIQCIGIAYDEPRRIKTSKNIRYPLFEYEITESAALKYCYDHGYKWNGLYDKFSRVSCWCCPLKRLDELKNLYQNYPELWKRLKDMESRSYNQFRIDYSVFELERRFANELCIM